ncbi:Lrp/AsnC family transcriptional regulator [Limibacter armeniacum]|uniref:Lrp/AsnC family transcriptional regulator n=1 Tax=Limibacter armeniacum TaxID=466084 RepID=UPI002FE5DDB6
MTDKQLDETDKKILEILQDDGRVTIKGMAEQLGLSTTPVFDRVKRLEKSGYIDKYVALLNPNRIDRKMVAFIQISLKNHTRSYLDKFAEEMGALTEVMECYHVAGSFDFLLKVSVKDMDAYRIFILNHLSTISSIAHVETFFVLQKSKYSTSYKL